MTKKDYKRIAGIVRRSPDRIKLVEEFVYTLKEDNERFDEDKFREACGVN